MTPRPARRWWQTRPMAGLAVGWGVIGLTLASTAIGLAAARFAAIFLGPH